MIQSLSLYLVPVNKGRGFEATRISASMGKFSFSALVATFVGLLVSNCSASVQCEESDGETSLLNRGIQIKVEPSVLV